MLLKFQLIFLENIKNVKSNKRIDNCFYFDICYKNYKHLGNGNLKKGVNSLVIELCSIFSPLVINIFQFLR